MQDPEVEGFLALAAARLAPRTVDAYRRDLAALTGFLGHGPAAATTPELERYLAELRAHGLAASTIARRTAAIRSFYRHQVLLGVRRDNPAAELELPRRRRTLPRTLSPGEAMRLIEEHLEVCAWCAREFNFEASVLHGLKRRLRQLDAPAALLAKVLSRLARHEGHD